MAAAGDQVGFLEVQVRVAFDWSMVWTSMVRPSPLAV